ncbi:MAG TPA: hypothetical protein DCX21_04510 [Eubacterium sp.]|nr:hypothetical protein [Eubacterium sp.]HBZ52657.1 hypothetical protein [Eubacterium sp.]
MLWKVIILLLLIYMSCEDIIKKRISVLLGSLLIITAAAGGFNLSGLAAGFVLYLLMKITGDGIGGGDVLIITGLGLYMGVVELMYLLCFSFFLASVAGIILLLMGRKKGYRMAFVPYITIGYIMWWIYV